MNRIIYYYQTFCGLEDIINIENPVVTHIHLSSIHFGLDDNQNPYIHLNNYPPGHDKFIPVWNELEVLNKKGVKIILMVGGAGGAFNNLFNNFEIYYELLKQTIKKYPIISGIDLDIEEYVELQDVKMLINKIIQDFGNQFIISMAPVSYALKADTPGMGGFIYKELFNSEEGKYIDYFNGQFYGDFTFDSYDMIINNNFPPEKVVIGMLSGENSGENFTKAMDELKKIKQKYSNMGGCFVWEYNNCPPDTNHYDWAINIQKNIETKNLYYNTCSII